MGYKYTIKERDSYFRVYKNLQRVGGVYATVKDAKDFIKECQIMDEYNDKN